MQTFGFLCNIARDSINNAKAAALKLVKAIDTKGKSKDKAKDNQPCGSAGQVTVLQPSNKRPRPAEPEDDNPFPILDNLDTGVLRH